MDCLFKLNSTHYLVHVHENNNCLDFIKIGDYMYPQTLELTYIRKDCQIDGLNKYDIPIPNIDFPNTTHYENHDLNFYPFKVKN